jgi:hypothetical protein
METLRKEGSVVSEPRSGIKPFRFMGRARETAPATDKKTIKKNTAVTAPREKGPALFIRYRKMTM